MLDNAIALRKLGPTGSTTLMNTSIEMAVPGFLLMQYTDFAIHQQLGKGGTAVLYSGIVMTEEARERANGNKVAIKVVSK